MKMVCWLSKNRSLRTLGSNLSNSESQILTLSFLLLDSLPYNADSINMKWFEKQHALKVFLPLNYIFIQWKLVQWQESVFALAKSTVGKIQVDDGLLQIVLRRFQWKILVMTHFCSLQFAFIFMWVCVCLCEFMCIMCAQYIRAPGTRDRQL